MKFNNWKQKNGPWKTNWNKRSMRNTTLRIHYHLFLPTFRLDTLGISFNNNCTALRMKSRWNPTRSCSRNAHWRLADVWILSSLRRQRRTKTVNCWTWTAVDFVRFSSRFTRTNKKNCWPIFIFAFLCARAYPLRCFSCSRQQKTSLMSFLRWTWTGRRGFRPLMQMELQQSDEKVDRGKGTDQHRPQIGITDRWRNGNCSEE